MVLRRVLRLKERRPDDLMTGIVGPDKKGGWSVIWVSDGPCPTEVRAPTLTEAVDQACAAAAELYARHPQSPAAELQLAIYPWKFRDGPMFDISGQPGRFTALDIQEICAAPIGGGTLEDLVAAMEQMPGAGRDNSMLRWVRAMSSLAPSASEPEGA